MAGKKNSFISILLCFFTTFLMGQVFTFGLSGNATDYKYLDSAAKANKKLAGSDSKSIHTTTDSSGYYFDNKKIKRKREYIVGQENKFTISGTIANCRTHQPIENVTIKLTGSDKSVIEIKSDKEGHYSLTNGLKPEMEYTLLVKETNEDAKKRESKYGLCPSGVSNPPGYGSEKINLTLHDTAKKIIHDFCLFPYQFELRLPTVCFKKNSTEFLIPGCDGYVTTDTTLDCFISFMMAYKSWVFEISGNSDKNEKDGQKLSEQRAKKVYDLLVSKGINPKRLVYKGYGIKHPVYHDKNFPQNTIKIIDGRVDFSVLHKGFTE